MNIKEIAAHVISLRWGPSITKFEKSNDEAIAVLYTATSFMPTDTSTIIRAMVTLEDIHTLPLCSCGVSLTWNKKAKTFNTHCSMKCRCNDPTVITARKKSLFDKYGVTNISNIPGVQDKKKDTCLANHGVEYPQQSTTIRHKTKQSVIDKYGVDHPTKDPSVAAKTKQTNLDRYGCEYPIASPLIIARVKEKNLTEHGVEFALQRGDVKAKSKVTNLQRRGVEYPMMSQNVRQTREDNNLDVYGVKYPIQRHLPLDNLTSYDWMYDHHITKQLSLVDIASVLNVDWSTIKTYLTKHNIDLCVYPEKQNEKRIATSQAKFDYNHYQQQHISHSSIVKLTDRDWMYTEHITNKKPLYVIGYDLGCSDGTVGRYLHTHGIPTHIHQASIGEREVADFVSSLNVQIITNDRKIIHPYELDIFIPDHNIAIEYCGLYWHSEQQGKDKHYHKRKLDLCSNQNIRLLTIYEDEWLNHSDIVKRKIKNMLQLDTTTRIYARSTEVCTIDHKTTKRFLDDYHIQGNGLSRVKLGLRINGEVVACMTFSKHNKCYTLTRYATKHSIIGGFSKLMKHFKDNYDWSQMVSFADRRWSEGNLYTITGWTLDCMLPPDYSYATSNTERFHKFNFRRKHLRKRLKHFDPTLSERVNCDNNGILRIWDCGKMRFIIDNVDI